MSSGSWPNFDLLISTLWGSGPAGSGQFTFVVGFVSGQNPAYALNDFLLVNPKFFGAATGIANCTTVANSQTVTGTAPSGFAIGQFITGPGIPNGTTVASLGSGTFTISNPATASGTVSLSVYLAPFVPIFVIQLFINLATACLVQDLWQDQWLYGMALFIAHYCTMWVRSDGDQYSNPGQIASSGIEKGMMVSKAVDGVSAGYQNMLENYADWGAWTETTYGALLITMAKTIGNRPALVW